MLYYDSLTLKTAILIKKLAKDLYVLPSWDRALCRASDPVASFPPPRPSVCIIFLSFELACESHRGHAQKRCLLEGFFQPASSLSSRA